jgi:DNA-binding CsgD family transcriptional regulator
MPIEQTAELLSEIQKFSDCKTWKDIVSRQVEYLANFGILGFLFGVCHSFSKAREKGLLNAVEVWTNYPDEYMRALAKSGLADIDFSSRCIVDFQRPFVWARAERYKGITPDEFARLRLDDGFGMNVGITIPLWRTPYSGSGIGLWANGMSADQFDKFWSKDGDKISLLCRAFELLMRKYAMRDRFPLTKRETDVLAYTAGGMSSMQIATHLGMSHRTVEGALSRARSRLRVQNTTEAVAKALVFELI